MEFNEYQKQAITTKLYHNSIDSFINTLEIPKQENRDKLKSFLCQLYVTLGLLGEAGEIAEKVKKIIRDKNCEFDSEKELLSKELGDVQWYVAGLADEMNIQLNNIAEENIIKLQSRKDRNKIQGSGDNR